MKKRLKVSELFDPLINMNLGLRYDEKTNRYKWVYLKDKIYKENENIDFTKQ